MVLHFHVTFHLLELCQLKLLENISSGKKKHYNVIKPAQTQVCQQQF